MPSSGSNIEPKIFMAKRQRQFYYQLPILTDIFPWGFNLVYLDARLLETQCTHLRLCLSLQNKSPRSQHLDSKAECKKEKNVRKSNNSLAMVTSNSQGNHKSSTQQKMIGEAHTRSYNSVPFFFQVLKAFSFTSADES